MRARYLTFAFDILASLSPNRLRGEGKRDGYTYQDRKATGEKYMAGKLR